MLLVSALGNNTHEETGKQERERAKLMREKASKVLFSLWRAAELGCLSVLI
jgi:hypothetical protein